ncbi:cell division topological specificity factor MinE [Pseudochelatococcus lubricantis]|uniref:Cell division topological specificity factor n=1 Tax=Pseudochelatococcus lubricantis TaxID=1538102 RepID=A0ABX0UYV9_9HYPH|nr:cell division topological specificity factor MinE [Pseudochelatococcus lubricantis]
MSFFKLFNRRSSAPVARERLQILLAHERISTGQSDLVAVLREEILAVIAKHIQLDSDKVKVTMDRGNAVSTLEVDIEIPSHIAPPAARDAAKKDADAPAARNAQGGTSKPAAKAVSDTKTASGALPRSASA